VTYVCRVTERAPEPGALLAGMTRETTIRRDASGRWFQDDVELEHPNLTEAFDGWIDVAEDGRFCLRNAINWAYVAIEGPPYVVRSARVDGEGVRLTLSGGREEPLDPATLRTGPDGALYCDVLGGRLAARFDRHAAFQLEPVLGEDATGAYVALGGVRYRPPRVDKPLAPRRAST